MGAQLLKRVIYPEFQALLLQLIIVINVVDEKPKPMSTKGVDN